MNSSPDRLIGGKYRLGQVLASGGMGTIHRGSHDQLERPVAIKVLRGQFLDDPVVAERFRREAQTVARLRHPHLVTIYDYGVDPELGAYLVMELLEGRTLREALREHGRIAIEDALAWVKQVCVGVQVAHQAGVVHRDLKPDNIFLEKTGAGAVARVLDFGIAKLLGANDRDPSVDPTITHHGGILGTPTYMSPEQCQALPVDPRSDVYSIGCVLYESLTGRPPFIGDSAAVLLAKHVNEAPVPPSRILAGVPPRLDEIVMKALAKWPSKRYPSAEAMVAALDTVGSDARSHDLPATPLNTDAHGSLHETVPLAPSHRPTRPKGNLPLELTSFVGRSREIGEVAARVVSNRALTLTGMGGIGKTRLALKVAAHQQHRFADGAWLVELAALDDPALVADRVANALGMPGQAGPPPFEALANFVAEKQLLVILDSCEHLVGACATLAETLLRVAPDLRILATSREALRFAGETTWQVPALSLPEGVTTSQPDRLMGSEAVRLFVDRASQARPGFQLGDESAAAVVAICARLEGIPLALELAAARAKVLSLEQICSKLEDRFRILSVASRSGLRRQHTLTAVFDWSFQLLSRDEQSLFSRLSVFAGGFTLPAAEAIAVGAPFTSSFEVLDGLAQLADKSLLDVDADRAEARYRLLETTRGYATTRLEESGDAETVRAVHRDWYRDLAERFATEARAAEVDLARSRLAVEYDNVRAALHWSLSREPGTEPTMRLCSALGPFWHLRGHWDEGRRCLESALEAGGSLSAGLRGRALRWAGVLAEEQGDFVRAKERLEEGLGLLRAAGESRDIAFTLHVLAHVAERMGDYDRAATLKDECAMRMGELDDPRGSIGAINSLGLRALYSGAYDRAEAHFSEALAIARKIGDQPNVGVQLHNLGEIALRRGDLDRAADHLEGSLAVARVIDAKRIVAYSNHLLAQVVLEQGDVERARGLLEESLVILREEGDKDGLAFVLEDLACTAAAAENPERALLLAGAAAALRDVINSTLSPPERADLERRLKPARHALGERVAEEILARGRDMDLAVATSFALSNPLQALR